MLFLKAAFDLLGLKWRLLVLRNRKVLLLII